MTCHAPGSPLGTPESTPLHFPAFLSVPWGATSCEKGSLKEWGGNGNRWGFSEHLAILLVFWAYLYLWKRDTFQEKIWMRVHSPHHLLAQTCSRWQMGQKTGGHGPLSSSRTTSMTISLPNTLFWETMLPRSSTPPSCLEVNNSFSLVWICTWSIASPLLATGLIIGFLGLITEMAVSN